MSDEGKIGWDASRGICVDCQASLDRVCALEDETTAARQRIAELEKERDGWRSELIGILSEIVHQDIASANMLRGFAQMELDRALARLASPLGSVAPAATQPEAIADAIIDENMEAIHRRKLSFREARDDLRDRIVRSLTSQPGSGK